MKPSEFKKAITLLRDCENETDFIVHLYDLVEPEAAVEPVKEPEKVEKKTPEKKKAPAAATKETEKATGQQDKPKKPKVWKPKKCIVCGKTFQPKNNRQMKCNYCLNFKDIHDVVKDTKETAAELAAMAK